MIKSGFLNQLCIYNKYICFEVILTEYMLIIEVK